MGSCDKLDGEEYEGKFRLELRGDTLVKHGEPLSVYVEKTFRDYYYEFFVPGISNGFSGSTYTVEKASLADEGWYKVHAYNDGLVAADSLYVSIRPDSIPCTHTVNQLTSNTSMSLNFYGVGGRNFSDDYIVDANAVGGDLSLTFSKMNKQPIAGTYKCVAQSSFAQYGEVSMYINYGAIMSGVPGQSVHVSTENGKTYITLCDFVVRSGTFGEISINTKLEL